MMLQGDDWHILRKPILMSSTVVLVIILLVGVAYQYSRYQTVALQQAKLSHKKAQQRLQLVQQEQVDRLQYLPQYQHLMAGGFIGEERRQQWLAQLWQVREQHDLFEIDYDISQQQSYQPSFIEKADGHQLYRSVMTLKLGLLHAGDLLQLLSGLRQNTSPFMLRDCEIIRIADMKDNPDASQENLKARCEIDWLTLKPFDAKEAL